jgi:cobaltochelatase CobT
MPTRQPIAFLSYVRSDDEHDGGRITAFRQRLEGEVKMQTGKPFAIFQDRNDIAWGQNWEERINSSISDVTFLIPVLTPSFFQSPACRSEFKAFLLREKTLGVNRLILPLYYVSCDELDGVACTRFG